MIDKKNLKLKWTQIPQHIPKLMKMNLATPVSWEMRTSSHIISRDETQTKQQRHNQRKCKKR